MWLKIYMYMYACCLPLITELLLVNTVEPLIKDPSRKGQLSTRDTSNIPKSVYAIHFNSEKRTTSLQGTKWLVPNCPLLGGFTLLLNY